MLINLNFKKTKIQYIICNMFFNFITNVNEKFGMTDYEQDKFILGQLRFQPYI